MSEPAQLPPIEKIANHRKVSAFADPNGDIHVVDTDRQFLDLNISCMFRKISTALKASAPRRRRGFLRAF